MEGGAKLNIRVVIEFLRIQGIGMGVLVIYNPFL